MSYQDKVTELAVTYREKHKLYDDDGIIRCICGDWFFTATEAGLHFQQTTTAHVEENTGWRGFWKRLRGRW